MKDPTLASIFADIPSALPAELENLLASGKAFRLKRIVSRGHCSAADDWYDQDETEWVILLSGSARLAFADGKTLSLQPGDHVMIPAHCRHRVDWTTPDADSIWLALYFSRD